MTDRLNKEDFSSISEWSTYIGRYGESRFIEECAKRNIACMKTDSHLRYDFIVDVDGIFKKIQVKSISRYGLHKNIYRMELAPRGISYQKRKNKKYTKDDVDYFAIYAVDLNLMYLVPSSVLLNGENDRPYMYDSSLISNPTTDRKAIDISKYKSW